MKLLIKEACQLAGEAISTHADVGDTVDATKDDAALLTRMGRAFYLDKSDDPTKGTLTATAEDKAAVKKAANAVADMLKERAAASPEGAAAAVAAANAAMVASAVTAALTAAGIGAPKAAA